MESDVVDRLLALNQAFYTDFAERFSASRSPSEPGFERLVALMGPGARVLDLGCGQARLARLLPAPCSYVGVDYADAMLKLAPQTLADHGIDVRLVAADIVKDDWAHLVGHAFDWVVLRAVLHHIPGLANRQQVLSRAAEVLASHGRVVIANWQFLRIERLRRRVLPWSAIGLDDDDVEPGDYLLDWQRHGHGMRYAHLIDEEETRRLAHGAELEAGELFYADGHTNDLTLYAVLHRQSVMAP